MLSASNVQHPPSPAVEVEPKTHFASLEVEASSLNQSSLSFWLKKLRGGILLVLGYLLSPLSWWNDLIFNLPIAYGFGYLFSLFSQDWFIPCSIAGYWLSNVLGVLLMQAGLVDVVQDQPKPRSLRQELLVGCLSSTAYTLVILTLFHFNILETPNLFPAK